MVSASYIKSMEVCVCVCVFVCVCVLCAVQRERERLLREIDGMKMHGATIKN